MIRRFPIFVLAPIAHNEANDINAFAFSSGQPNLMYLGLEVESGVR